MDRFLQDGSLLDALVYADWLEDQWLYALAEDAREKALEPDVSENSWCYEPRYSGGGVGGGVGVCGGGVVGGGVG